MGKYFDFPKIDFAAPDASEPILLFQAARAKKRQMDLAEQHQRELERHNQAAEGAALLRAKTDEARAQEQHSANMTKALQDQGKYIEQRKAAALAKIGGGDVTGARADLADVPWMTPKGERHFGLNLEEMKPPPRPTPGPEVSENINYMTREPYAGSLSGGAPATSGPGESAVEGRPDLAALMGRALGEGRERQTAETRGDTGLQDSYKQFLAQDAAAQKTAEEYKANPHYRIGGGPAGTDIETTAMDARNVERSQRALNAGEMTNAIANDPNPFVKQYGPSLINVYNAGGMKREEMMKYLEMLRRDDMTAEQKAAALDAAMQRAKVVAHGRPNTAADSLELRAWEAKQKRTQTDFERGIKRYGLDKEGPETISKIIDDILPALDDTSPLAGDRVKAAIIYLGRMKQGLHDRFSNDDYNVLVKEAGGLLTQIADILPNVEGGDISARHKELARHTAMAIKAALEGRYRRVVPQLMAQFDPLRHDMDYLDSLAGQSLPAGIDIHAPSHEPSKVPDVIKKLGSKDPRPGAAKAKKASNVSDEELLR